MSGLVRAMSGKRLRRTILVAVLAEITNLRRSRSPRQLRRLDVFHFPFERP